MTRDPDDAQAPRADHLRRRGCDRPERARARRRRRDRDRDRHVRGELPRPRRPRPPGHELPRARRHDGEPRGPAAASAPRRPRAGARTCSRGSRSSPSASTSSCRRYASVVFDEIAEHCFGGITYAEIGERAELPERGEAPTATPASVDSTQSRGQRLHQASAWSPTARSSPGRPSSARRSCSSSGPIAVVELSPDDARSRGIRNGATVTVVFERHVRRAARADRARPRGRRRAHRRRTTPPISTPWWR